MAEDICAGKIVGGCRAEQTVAARSKATILLGTLKTLDNSIGGHEMVSTWKTGSAPEEKCENCGTVYSVSIFRSPAKDRDHFDCFKCGNRMREWNDTNIYRYELKKPGEQ